MTAEEIEATIGSVRSRVNETLDRDFASQVGGDAYEQRALAYEQQLNRDAALADLKRALSLADQPEDHATIQAELARIQK